MFVRSVFKEGVIRSSSVKEVRSSSVQRGKCSFDQAVRMFVRSVFKEGCPRSFRLLLCPFELFTNVASTNVQAGLGSFVQCLKKEVFVRSGYLYVRSDCSRTSLVGTNVQEQLVVNE